MKIKLRFVLGLGLFILVTVVLLNKRSFTEGFLNQKQQIQQSMKKLRKEFLNQGYTNTDFKKIEKLQIKMSGMRFNPGQQLTNKERTIIKSLQQQVDQINDKANRRRLSLNKKSRTTDH